MKILCTQNQIVYDIPVTKDGENAMPCPVCTPSRKHKRKKSFSWNNKLRTGYCHNCESSFVEYNPQQKKEYVLPRVTNKTALTDKAVAWFVSRGINQTTLNKMGIYSAMEWMPQVGKETSVICFPYYVDDKLVNVKYRDGAKNFKLVKDAELVFYNLNATKDKKEVVIVEGEIDCLSYVEAGVENCISVPNGASARNMEYLDNYFHVFDKENIEKIYLATDNDIHGLELREELIRRLGAERCSVVNFGNLKDANEYLIKHGRNALAKTIEDAVEVPVKGIVNLNYHYDDIYNLFVAGMEVGKGVGFEDIDKAVTWELGRLAIFTGIPSHGKSEFVDFIVTRLNIVHGWKVGYFSPENYPVKYHYAKIASKISGKSFEQRYMNQLEFDSVFDYIINNFFFIYPEDDMGFETIIEKAEYLVRKHGIKVLVLDPYNKIEHMRERGETETEYISRFLDKLIMFGKRFNVLVILVAHPRKMEKGPGGIYVSPSLYDISGSANFYNKADYGLSVYRHFKDPDKDNDDDSPVNLTTVGVMKVKFRHLGDGGEIRLKYNFTNGRYEKEDSTTDEWNYQSYLNPKKEEQNFWVQDEEDAPF